MIKRILPLISALILVPALAGHKLNGASKGHLKKTPLVGVTLDSTNWFFMWGEDDPANPKTLYPNVGEPGWYFSMPIGPDDPSFCWTAQPCPQVDYILIKETLPITNRFLVITAEVVVTSGFPVFNYKMEESNTCPGTAEVHALIQVINDDYVSEFGRWWSNPIKIVLADGTGLITVTIPISPDQWSDVYGHSGAEDASRLAGFQQALATPGFVGLTFGGGCFFGHGVNVTDGTANFVLHDYRFLDQ